MTQPIHAISDDEEPKRKKGAYIALIIGVVLVLALLGWAAWALFGGGAKSVRIDDVTGKPLAEAIKIIEDQGLVVGDRTPQPSEEKKNTVLAQNPPANTEVEEGSTVDLTFSSGPEQVTVPELVGLPQSEAINRLQNAGLQVGAIDPENSDQPAGTVLDSNPKEGDEVDKGKAVDLVISTGEVEVPDVVGETQSAAEGILTREGFDPNVVFQETDEGTDGTVISQSPSGGSTASRGTVVTITVATAPPSPTPTDSASPSPDESSPGNGNGNP